MSIVSLKRYLWVIYLALIAAGVYIGADLFWAILGSQMVSGSRLPTTAGSATAETSERRPFQQYGIIQERNLFGARGRVAPPPPARTAPGPTASTRQPINLKLVGTVVGNSAQTYAVIEDVSAKRQELYRLGDLVKEAKVIEITRNRVVIDHRGRREELLSFENPASGSPTAAAPPPPASGSARRPAPAPPPQEPRENVPERPEQDESRSENDIEIERVSENTWRISRDEVVEQLDNLGGFMQDVRLTPHFNAGQPSGFMVSNLPPQSILARMGLRNGDIMKGANGQDFASLGDVLQIYQQLQTEPTLQLEIERGNRVETLTYEIR
jgi:general secretion pathway protein C